MIKRVFDIYSPLSAGRITGILLIGLFVAEGCCGGAPSTEKTVPSVQTIQVGQFSGDLKRKIDLKPGDVAKVFVSDNPTTGHQWRLMGTLPENITVDSKFIKESSGQTVGSGGMRCFTVKALASGVGKLQYGYFSVAEQQKPKRTLTLEIYVKD